MPNDEKRLLAALDLLRDGVEALNHVKVALTTGVAITQLVKLASLELRAVVRDERQGLLRNCGAIG